MVSCFMPSIFSISNEALLRATKHYSLLPSFIFWINLDIGLNVCFLEGFDAFWQAVFNFCIPVFIWIIVGLFIYISSKSRRVTRLIGGNAVKVLATIILISYTKILKNEVAVLSCARLQYPGINGSELNGPYKSHWLIDGNVECWQGKHLLLVVIGLLFWGSYHLVHIYPSLHSAFAKKLTSSRPEMGSYSETIL